MIPLGVHGFLGTPPIPGLELQLQADRSKDCDYGIEPAHRHNPSLLHNSLYHAYTNCRCVSCVSLLDRGDM